MRLSRARGPGALALSQHVRARVVCVAVLGFVQQLASSAQTFRRQGGRLKNQMWLRNLKWTLCLASIGIAILGGIVYGLYEVFKSD